MTRKKKLPYNPKNPCENCEHNDKPEEWCHKHCKDERILAMRRVFRRWTIEEAIEEVQGK
jgi:hypothetical protein